MYAVAQFDQKPGGVSELFTTNAQKPHQNGAVHFIEGGKSQTHVVISWPPSKSIVFRRFIALRSQADQFGLVTRGISGTGMFA